MIVLSAAAFRRPGRRVSCGRPPLTASRCATWTKAPGCPACGLSPRLGLHGDFWRFQTSVLRDRYRVIALDLPGFGQSDKPHDRPIPCSSSPGREGGDRPCRVKRAGAPPAQHGLRGGRAVLADYPARPGASAMRTGLLLAPDDPGRSPPWRRR